MKLQLTVQVAIFMGCSIGKRRAGRARGAYQGPCRREMAEGRLRSLAAARPVASHCRETVAAFGQSPQPGCRVAGPLAEAGAAVRS